MKIKKILPLASLAAVAATVVPAAVSCNKEEKGTFEVAAADVLGNKLIYGSLDKAKTEAVFTINMSKELAEGDELQLTDIVIDESSDLILQTGTGAKSPEVAVNSDNAKVAYVVIPLQSKDGETPIEANQKAKIKFTLSSTKGAFEAKTFDNLTFTMDTVVVDVMCNTETDDDDYVYVDLQGEIDSEDSSGLKTFVKGLYLASAPGTKTEFEGDIYMGTALTAKYNNNQLKSQAWAKATAYKDETAGDTGKNHLQFDAKLDTQIASGTTDFVYAPTKATETIQLLFVPSKATKCPFYSYLTLTKDSKTTGVPGYINIAITKA